MRLDRAVTVGLVLIAVGAVGSLATWGLARPHATAVDERTVDLAPVRSIEIAARNAAVDVFPTQATQARITLSGIRSGERLEVETAGSTLAIRVFNPRVINLFGGSPHLSVALPEKAYESLRARLQNGDLEAEQLEVHGLDVTTGNGRIHLDDIRAGTTEVDTQNGDITLNRLAGRIVARTSNGRISLSVRDLDRPIQLESANGDISVQAEQAPAAATFQLSAKNGRITVFGARTASPWRQVFGNGENLVQVTTRNGNITVTR